MRKPLKERENGSKITQDPKNDIVKNVIKLRDKHITYKPGEIIELYLEIKKTSKYIKNHEL